MNHWEYTENSPQRNFRVVSANHWELLLKEISKWFTNHQESPQRNFRVVHESPRITPKEISEWFVNCWKSSRITPKEFQSGSWIIKNHQESPQRNFRVVVNHWESLRITPMKFQSGLQITKNRPKVNFRVVCESLKNHLKDISEWFTNCWESLRIISKEISEWFANHWELSQRNFRVVCKSLTTTQRNCQSGLWITIKSQKRRIRSYLSNGPRPNDTDAWRSLYL